MNLSNASKHRTFTPSSAIFGPFLGHAMELQRNKGLLVTGQSRRTGNSPAVCLRSAVSSGFWGRFGPKSAVLGPKIAQFWVGTS